LQLSPLVVEICILAYSYLLAIIWIVIIFGIPMALGGLWWISHEMKKEP